MYDTPPESLQHICCTHLCLKLNYCISKLITYSIVIGNESFTLNKKNIISTGYTHISVNGYRELKQYLNQGLKMKHTMY